MITYAAQIEPGPGDHDVARSGFGPEGVRILRCMADLIGDYQDCLDRRDLTETAYAVAVERVGRLHHENRWQSHGRYSSIDAAAAAGHREKIEVPPGTARLGSDRFTRPYTRPDDTDGQSRHRLF